MDTPTSATKSGAQAPKKPQRMRSSAIQQIVVISLVVVVMLVLVAYPLLWLILGSVGIPDQVSLEAFGKLFTDMTYLRALINTLALAAAAGLLSLFLGVPLAWATARTDLPFKGGIHASVAAAYILPPYLTALAYIILAAPNSGYLNRLAAAFPGVPTELFNIFSFGGVVFAISLHVFALVYFFAYSALLAMDSSLEQAAQILGASRLRTLRRVTLPLVAPAIMAGALFAGVNSMALFAPQAFLGIPAGVSFLPTLLYGSLQRFPPLFAEASAVALALVILTVAGLFVQRALVTKKSYITITGKAERPELVPLKSWKWPMLAYCWGVVLVSIVLPIGVLLYASLSRNWLAPFGAGNLTLSNFTYAVLQEQVSQRGIVNSLLLASGAATICMVLGLLVAYIDLRTDIRGRRLLDYLAILPLGLPGIVLALGVLQGWIRVPLPVYATIWILLIAYTARFLPLAVRSANNSLLQLDPSLEEAGRISGASWARVLTRITFPLLRPGLLVGWILVFVPAVAELGATILLYTQGTETISVAIFRLQEQGRIEVVAALAIVTSIITLLALAVIKRIAGRDIDEIV